MRTVQSTSFRLCLVLSSIMTIVPAVSAQTPVVVANTAAQALPVKDLFNGALQPVTIAITLDVLSGDTRFTGATYQVPFGKRLILESYSTYATSSTPGTKVVFSIQQPRLHGNPTLFFPAMQTDPSGFPATDLGNLRAYMDAGSYVVPGGLRNTAVGTMSVRMVISGHLVDVP